MEGIKNKENWIDLSNLPRFEGVTKHKNINWKASVGYMVPFVYKSIDGIAKILDVNITKRYLIVYIDGWTCSCGQRISIQNFQTCNLYGLYNKISVLSPNIMKYLDNVEDAYKYSPSTNYKLHMHCPHCGHHEVRYPYNINKYGFKCVACGDGVSYPNKIMFNILTQLHILFEAEVGSRLSEFRWCKKYRYDFYFSKDKKHYLIEMDGHFHDRDKEKKNDLIKDQLARKNNMKLIRIDCKYQGNPFRYIKNNIENSELANVLPLQMIDWKLCDSYASSSLMRTACLMWEMQGYSIGEIMEFLSLSKTTIRKYLLRGVILGLCPSYNKNESRRRCVECRKKKNIIEKQYKMIRNNEVVLKEDDII